MKRSIVLFVLIASSVLWGQSNPTAPVAANSRAEIFGGYTYMRTDFSAPLQNANGFTGSFTAFVSSKVGITAQGSAEFGKSSFRNYTMMIGPRYNLGGNRYQPYVHAL